ncbi:alpha/beta hydrolase [Streptomyces sp. NPDC059695]|uniref:alpha/beta hydrolase n=1 Tax=Streptomyces sp. NPDC059695 TaxID=3346910 RepID=UPI0036C91CB1
MARLPRGPRRAPSRGRLRRTLLAALVTAAVAVPVAGAARPVDVPAPAPAPAVPLAAATPAELAARYAAGRQAVRAAERSAEEYGAHRRAAALRAMAADGRQFLAFDGRDGGRGAEVVGDLARADRIAVLVPGADTDLDRYGRFRAGAVALHHELRSALGARAAVVAWLGYRTPATGSTASLTPGRAERAAPALRAFVGELRAAKPGARITLVCHSYGSVVCARASSGLPVDALVLHGSPGTGSDTVADLHTRAAVWAGRGTADWIGDVPHVRLPLLPGSALGFELGFGEDPLDPAFGARAFDAGDGGHSDYLVPGSVPLANTARIADGREPGRA